VVCNKLRVTYHTTTATHLLHYPSNVKGSFPTAPSRFQIRIYFVTIPMITGGDEETTLVMVIEPSTWKAPPQCRIKRLLSAV